MGETACSRELTEHRSLLLNDVRYALGYGFIAAIEATRF